MKMYGKQKKKFKNVKVRLGLSKKVWKQVKCVFCILDEH